MDANFKPSLKLVLVSEGGYVNHPQDPGGPTNQGVTQAVYDAYRRAKGESQRSVQLITQSEVDDIYKQQYWDRVQGDRLPAGIDYSVFDFAVNSGVKRAVLVLQRVVGVVADGVMGDLTLAAACAMNPTELLKEYTKQRLKFLMRLKTWSTFGKGWTARIQNVFNDSAKLLNGVPAPPAVIVADQQLALAASTKAPEAQIAQLKTNQGRGYALAGTGATGTTFLANAQQLKPQIGETVLGRAALVAVVFLTVVGGLFIAYSKLRELKDKGVINWAWIK